MADKANWVEISADDLPEDIRQAYDAYKLAYKHMKAQRERFEQAMADRAEVPKGRRLVFGYNFGKLSVAVVDDDRKPAKAATPKLSLTEFMAQQQASGRAV